MKCCIIVTYKSIIIYRLYVLACCENRHHAV